MTDIKAAGMQQLRTSNSWRRKAGQATAAQGAAADKQKKGMQE